MAGAVKGLVLLLASVFVMALMAGCTDARALLDLDGPVSSTQELDGTFSVGKGTDRIVARVTAGPSSGGGVVEVMLALMSSPGPGNVGLGTVAAGTTGEVILEDPAPGSWFIEVDGENGYEGQVSLVVSADGGGALFSIGGTFWDITGVVLALAIAAGGLYLYRRRSHFLTRELHRIDETVQRFNDDVDECRTNLTEMRSHIKDLLVKRKIQENQYLILERRIDTYLADLATPGNRHKAGASATREFDLEME